VRRRSWVRRSRLFHRRPDLDSGAMAEPREVALKPPTATSMDLDLKTLLGSDTEFRAETLYFIVLARFHEGKPDKAREEDEL
jgi:hypothetical protein